MVDLLLYALGGLVATAAATRLVRVGWDAAGLYKIRRAGPRPLFGVEHVLWREPADIARLDLDGGPGGRAGAPAPPFHFIEEQSSGSQPCVSVVDARGRRWRVKWGPEVQCETFAVRLAWACGYFAEITYYVPEGAITNAPALRRAGSHVDEGGHFRDARFELDDPAVLKLFEEHSWSWTDNPFVGTPPLAGLKILLMLISNWDNKDRRDVARGSNTAIYVHRVSRWKREAQYLIADWGGSMGRWGSTIVTRGRWDPDGFATQTPSFVTGVQGGTVTFGYAGQRTTDASSGISVADVRWLCHYLGQLTNAQLRTALLASGATEDEANSFTASLRARIEQLRGAAGGALEQ